MFCDSLNGKLYIVWHEYTVDSDLTDFNKSFSSKAEQEKTPSQVGCKIIIWLPFRVNNLRTKFYFCIILFSAVK